MTGVEITLLIIGLIFLLGSFLVHDKLSQKDIDQIAKMSETEMQVIVEKELKDASSKVEEAISGTLDTSMEETKREMEKTTNQKIMAISEYSDTVLENMNKTHNEIVFLYNMLNDKHTELTNMAGQLQQFTENIKTTEHEALRRIQETAEELQIKMQYSAAAPQPAAPAAGMPDPEPEEAGDGVPEAPLPAAEDPESNKNAWILSLHQQGMSDVDIAKELGCGLGEVKLVIGLFKGEKEIEA